MDLQHCSRELFICLKLSLVSNVGLLPLCCLLMQDEAQLPDMLAVLEELAGSWQGLEAAVSKSEPVAQQQLLQLLQQVSRQCPQLDGRVSGCQSLMADVGS